MKTVEELAEIIYNACHDSNLNLLQATVQVINRSGAAMNQAYFNDVQDSIRRYRDSHKDLEVHTRSIHAALYSSPQSATAPAFSVDADTKGVYIKDIGVDRKSLEGYFHQKGFDTFSMDTAIETALFLHASGANPDLSKFEPAMNQACDDDCVQYDGKVYSLRDITGLEDRGVEDEVDRIRENAWELARDNVNSWSKEDLVDNAGFYNKTVEIQELGNNELLIIEDAD